MITPANGSKPPASTTAPQHERSLLSSMADSIKTGFSNLADCFRSSCMTPCNVQDEDNPYRPVNSSPSLPKEEEQPEKDLIDFSGMTSQLPLAKVQPEEDLIDLSEMTSSPAPQDLKMKTFEAYMKALTGLNLEENIAVRSKVRQMIQEELVATLDKDLTRRLWKDLNKTDEPNLLKFTKKYLEQYLKNDLSERQYNLTDVEIKSYLKLKIYNKSFQVHHDEFLNDPRVQAILSNFYKNSP